METTSVIGASNSRLVNLPAELFERVAQLTPIEDLLTLRATCRQARNKVQRTFVQAHFTNRGFLLCDQESLETGAKMVEHEELGAAMKSITLRAQGISMGISMYRDVDSSDEDEDAVTLNLPTSDTGVLRARWAVSNKCSEMRDSGKDIEILTALFSRVRERGLDVVVKVNTFGRRSVDKVPVTRFAQLTDEIGWAWVQPEPEDSSAVDIVFAAILRSGYKAQKIVLGSVDWPLAIRGLSAIFESFSLDSYIFSELTSLELWLNSQGTDAPGEPVPYTASLMKCLAPALQLKEVRAIMEDPYCQVLRFLAHSHGFRSLKVFCLVREDVDFKDLVMFAGKHKDHLDKIELQNCRFEKAAGTKPPDDDPAETLHQASGFPGLVVDDDTAEEWWRKAESEEEISDGEYQEQLLGLIYGH